MMDFFIKLTKDAERNLEAEIWEQRQGVFTEPPCRTPSDTFVDGPLLGNGDLGIAIGGDAAAQTFYIGKTDFWTQASLGETGEQRIDRLLHDRGRRTGTGMTTVGQVILDIPQLQGASYHQEQDILHAEVRGCFTKDTLAVTMCSWVDANSNLLVTELAYVNIVPLEIEITVEQHAGKKDAYEVFNYETGIAADIFWFQYAANPANVPENRRVAVATGISGKQARFEDHFHFCQAVFTMKPGEKVLLATAINSNLDAPDFGEFSREMLRALTMEQIRLRKAKHREWWRSFWGKSSIAIGDPILEKYYYGSNYILASCIRPGKVPPGLFGNWVTTDRPTWTGSYTLNYNYESPYWGLYTGNHTDITESYCEPLLAAIPLGKIFAKEFLGCRGIYFPVEMGPWGSFCSMMFHDQKINAVFAAVNLLMHFDYTYDPDYARKVYPYLLEAADFWEDYLVYEDGRYSIYDDSIHERSKDKKNPVHTMGMVQMLFKGILVVSNELNLNPERYQKWQQILDHFSPYPVFEKNGRLIFRFTEDGMEYRDDNTVGTQHIYPAGMIGFSSNPQLLQTAWNTVHEMQRWSDFNAFPTYFTTAARVGYDPEVILEKLRMECVKQGFPNLGIHHGGGGIEDCNGVPSCLHEMMLQSYEGIIRLFPVWPGNREARFGTLRASGAFLVSSEFKGGRVRYIALQSEKGRDCTILNPWTGQPMYLYRDTGGVERLTGERITIKTAIGEQLLLLPEGTELAELEV